MYENMKTQ